MSAPKRPHITVFAILSIDGRVLTPTSEDLARQESALRDFDAVALDGCSMGDGVPALSVWLGRDALGNLAQAAAAGGRAVVFTSRAIAEPVPSHVQVLREVNRLDRRLYRLRRETQTRRLLCPLGCHIGAGLVAQDLVDELRLTLRSNIMGGRKSPTLSGPPGASLLHSTRWTLRQLVREENGCHLMYRRV